MSRVTVCNEPLPVTVDDALAVLQQIFEMDPEAIAKMLAVRVPCNERLAGHSTVQVSEDAPGQFTVGVMGLLNGIFGVRTNMAGYLAYILEQDGRVSGFCRTDHIGHSSGNTLALAICRALLGI
jgi:hypothetical protein